MILSVSGRAQRIQKDMIVQRFQIFMETKSLNASSSLVTHKTQRNQGVQRVQKCYILMESETFELFLFSEFLSIIQRLGLQ